MNYADNMPPPPSPSAKPAVGISCCTVRANTRVHAAFQGFQPLRARALVATAAAAPESCALYLGSEVWSTGATEGTKLEVGHCLLSPPHTHTQQYSPEHLTTSSCVTEWYRTYTQQARCVICLWFTNVGFRGNNEILVMFSQYFCLFGRSVYFEIAPVVSLLHVSLWLSAPNIHQVYVTKIKN